MSFRMDELRRPPRFEQQVLPAVAPAVRAQNQIDDLVRMGLGILPALQARLAEGGDPRRMARRICSSVVKRLSP